MTGPLSAHLRQHFTRQLGGREEVQLHLGADLCGGEFFQRPVRTGAGDVGQHVDAAEGFYGLLQGGGARRRIGHVQLQSQRAFAVTGGDRLQRRQAAGGEHHVVALGQHGLSQSGRSRKMRL